MSDKSSGDNKMHQILMAVITTIAAPIVVFMITNNLKSNSAVATVAPPTLAATLPSQPGATDVPAQPTLPGISNPSGSIPAGVPALVDGLALTVSTQDVSSDGQFIHVRVHVKNTGADRRTLVFSPGAVMVQDDSGHRYEAAYGEKKSGCNKTDLSASRNMTIDPQGDVILSSVDAANPVAWCADTSTGLPLFTGPIIQGAKKLHVQINGIGPFKGFQVEIGL